MWVYFRQSCPHGTQNDRQQNWNRWIFRIRLSKVNSEVIIFIVKTLARQLGPANL